MNPDAKNELLHMGEHAAHELKRFIKIYDLKYDSTNFVDILEAKLSRTDEVIKSYTTLIDRLEQLVHQAHPKSIESEYCGVLGTYMCDVLNALNSYRCQLNSVARRHAGASWLGELKCTIRHMLDYRKHQKQYLNAGVKLKALWTIMMSSQGDR